MRNSIGKLMIAAATLLAAQVFIGCGDSDSDTAGSNSGGSGKNNGGSNDGSDGKGGSGDSFGGAPATACLNAEEHVCQEHRGNMEAFFEAANEACVEDGGTVVPSCSKDDLVGTCTHVASGIETIVYFYGDHDPEQLKPACEMQGTWNDA